jgi:hypothetical protein
MYFAVAVSMAANSPGLARMVQPRVLTGGGQLRPGDTFLPLYCYYLSLFLEKEWK